HSLPVATSQIRTSPDSVDPCPRPTDAKKRLSAENTAFNTCPDEALTGFASPKLVKSQRWIGEFRARVLRLTSASQRPFGEMDRRMYPAREVFLCSSLPLATS